MVVSIARARERALATKHAQSDNGRSFSTMFSFFKSRRRAALRNEPLTPAQRALLNKNVPYLAKLDDADRAELEGLVQIFMAEKSFEGCGGLEITEEIKVTIAAQACLLL